ncbi:hypothetical protein [Pedobacter helvus]|uniref:Uncharacterized protein n=1 Tax=Pedobacter helvus TaxID=2563444 RepID=A0ABW9JKU2_9SPHI|nr:hypothetical protein [Pedobacter ureilyticus]
MKKVLILFIAIWAQSSYAQKKNDLFVEDEKIRSILNSNLTPILYPDSIALYTFYIKVTPKKNGINSIYTNRHLAKKVYGNIDSLFHKVDFSIFLKGTKQKHVIIPVGILILEHNKMNPSSRLDTWGLKNGVPSMFADDDQDRYKSVFLRTIFMLVSTKIYN